MHRALILAALGLVVAASHATSTENSTVRRAAAYGSDDKWWKCNVDPSKGCETGPLDKLGLTQDEQKYVRATLDRIPWHPKKATPQEVASVVGQEAREHFGKQVFVGAGPGADPNRGVSAYYFKGYVSMIHWFQPGRFLLVKHHPDPY